MSKMAPLTVDEVRKVLAANRKGNKPATLFKDSGKEEQPMDFVSSLGDDSIDRFDNKKKKKKKKKKANTAPRTTPDNNRKQDKQ